MFGEDRSAGSTTLVPSLTSLDVEVVVGCRSGSRRLLRVHFDCIGGLVGGVGAVAETTRPAAAALCVAGRGADCGFLVAGSAMAGPARAKESRLDMVAKGRRDRL